METFYVDKRFLGHSRIVKEDSRLLTPTGEIPIFKNQVIFENQLGEQVVMGGDYFQEYYVPVKKVEKKKAKPSKSPFEEQYAKALIEFNQMEMNQTEDENYINELKELSENKAF